MKTNLEWINQEWERWVENESTALGLSIDKVLDIESKEHIAKLFAAFCLNRLRIESEAMDSVG